MSSQEPKIVLRLRLSSHLADFADAVISQEEAEGVPGKLPGLKESCRQNADVIKRIGTRVSMEEAFSYALGCSDRFTSVP